jgi:hypothetical protein
VNPLEQYPEARKVLYLIQWITTGLTALGGIYFATIQEPTPQWFTLVVALLAFVWSYTGITAQQNVTTRGGDNGMFGNPLEREPVERDEQGVYRYDSAGGVIILVLAIVGIVLLILLLADKV